MEDTGCAGQVIMGKGRSEEAKCAVLVILCKCAFNPIDPVGYLEVLVKLGRFIRVNGGEDFIMVDVRL